MRLAVRPKGIAPYQLVGAACLCGVADTVALLMADVAFASHAVAALAKLAVLAASAFAALLGAATIFLGFRLDTKRT